MENIYKKNYVVEPLRRIHMHFKNDSLFRNSIYLMLSSGVQAVFGFVFWVINAHLYTPEQIGIGSTLISSAIFVSYFSLLGFNSTLVKFLPGGEKSNEKINTCLMLVLMGSILVALLYLLSFAYIAPDLRFIEENTVLALAFVVFSVFSSLNLLTDSIFIAYRASGYNFLIYSIQSFIKILLPLLFIGLGAFGIYASSGLAAGIAMFLSLYYASKKFNYIPKVSIDKAILKSFWKFSSANYIANFLNIIPPAVIPIIILNKLGAAQAGYFYLAFTICNLLYAVVYAVSQSLFAEGSYGEASLRSLFKRSVVIIGAIMVPAGILLALSGPYILGIFGKSYGKEAGRIIEVLALAAPAVSAYILGGVLLRIMNKNILLVLMNVVYALAIGGLALLWVDKGLVWIGYAWIVGHIIAALFSFIPLFLDELSFRKRNIGL